MDWQHTLDINPSRIAMRLSLLVTVLCLLALALCGLSLVMKGWLALLLVAGRVRQQRMQENVVVSRIGYGQQQWWGVVRGEYCRFELVGQQLVLHWLMVLHVRDLETAKIFHIVLWPDSASHDALRRLRVILRHL